MTIALANASFAVAYAADDSSSALRCWSSASSEHERNGSGTEHDRNPSGAAERLVGPAGVAQMIRPVIINTRPTTPTITLPPSSQRRRAMMETPANTIPT
jgi:hypothetical protein